MVEAEAVVVEVSEVLAAVVLVAAAQAEVGKPLFAFLISNKKGKKRNSNISLLPFLLHVSL